MSSAPSQGAREKFPAGGQSTLSALRNSYGSKEQLDRADSYVSRFVYRPISFYLTVPFVWLGCSANQVTCFRAALAVISAALVAIPARASVILGSSLYAFCILLDYVDGNLARLHGATGIYGAQLEEIADQVGPSLFPFAVGLGLYLKPDRFLALFNSVDPIWALFLGVFGSITYCLGTMAILYFRLLPVRATRYASGTPARPGRRISMAVTSKALNLGKFLVNEGVYLATVVGVLMAAGFNAMSIYLAARCVRNTAFFATWVWRLGGRLYDLKISARL